LVKLYKIGKGLSIKLTTRQRAAGSALTSKRVVAGHVVGVGVKAGALIVPTMYLSHYNFSRFMPYNVMV
jgi:hypothetical protein